MKTYKFTSILALLCCMALTLSCTGKGEKAAGDFITAVNQRDTAKLSQVIAPHHGYWADVTLADVNPEGLKCEKAGDNAYRIQAGQASFMLTLTDGEPGYQIISAQGVFVADKQDADSAVARGLLAHDHDDLAAMKAVHLYKVQKQKDELAIKALKQIYEKAVLTFAQGNFDPEKYFTPRLTAKLKAANEYDDGGLALWELRTGAQDGDGPSKVLSIAPAGDDWYVVKYLDMGLAGETKLKAVFHGSQVQFDDYKSKGNNFGNMMLNS